MLDCAEVPGSHILLVVIRQGEFPLCQHELPLQKMPVLFTLLPQHPFIEAWAHSRKTTQSCMWHLAFLIQKDREENKLIWSVSVKILVALLTSWLFRHAAKPVYLAQFCICLRTCIVKVGLGINAETLVRWHHLWCTEWVDTWFLLWIPSFRIWPESTALSVNCGASSGTKKQNKAKQNIFLGMGNNARAKPSSIHCWNAKWDILILQRPLDHHYFFLSDR